MKYLSKKKIISNKILANTLISILFIVVIFYDKLPFIEPNVYKTYLFLGFVFITIPFLFEKFKNNKIDRYIGELSFPIYITHMFILTFTTLNKFPKIESIGLTTLIITVIFSVFIHHFLVRPIENWRQARV
jgi:peptidoglycan/LPS O-acetylase OafA/YrhL